MTAARALLVVVLGGLAACGDNRVAPDAGVACHAVLTGNIDEITTTPDACPTLEPGAGASRDATLLVFAVPSPALGADLGIRIDLGVTPTPGVYTSGTTMVWTALGIENVAGGGACIFIGGNNAVPSGDFVLDLATVAPTAHGTLVLDLFVLPRTDDQGNQTDCGPGTTEQVRLTF